VISVLCCSSSAPPTSVGLLQASSSRSPVVFVPGVTGVELRDESSQKIYWGIGRNLLTPRDRGYRVARPIGSHGGAPALGPGGVILQLRVAGIFHKLVYRPLVDLFIANGYKLGDLASPRADDTFFLFSYDWRQDNVTSARLLAERLEQVRKARGQSRLEVTLLCQSNGSHICRYYTKYGGLTLDEAERGESVKTGVDVIKLGLLGSSNGGSLRVLRELNRGRKYIKGVGRVFSQEVLFTFIALFQDLPTYTDDLFVDERGRELAVDLFDVENWVKYGWSIYGEGPRSRLSKSHREDLFGTRQERYDYLDRLLSRAKRFHRLLRSDSPDFGSTRVYLVENGNNPTPERAVLLRSKDSWETLFPGDRELKGLSIPETRLSSPGDGHATVESQRCLSPQEIARLVREPVDVEGWHFEMILAPETQNEILRIVAD
jgi:hypothetical protein